MDDRADDVATGAWLDEVGAVLDRCGEAAVPCDGCTACCTAGQFVHIEPDEVETLARVPVALLAPAPGLPGHVVIGYDRDGRCPMLGPGGCRIYAHRPRTCREYDCRVFPAAGVRPDHPAVEAAARRWTFRTASSEEVAALARVRRASGWLASHPGAFPSGRVPAATGLALAALAVEGMFAGADGPDAPTVRAALAARRPG